MRDFAGIRSIRLGASVLACSVMMMFLGTAASAATPRPAAAGGQGARITAPANKVVTSPAKPPTKAPTTAPSATATPTIAPDVVKARIDLVWWMWTSTLGAALLGFLVFALLQWARPSSATVSDKDLEASRISYGFWLIIGGLLLTLAVVIVTLTHFTNVTTTMSDVIAIITAVTGVIGTLTAAFFGIQAAGAGRSQALSALGNQMQSQANAGGVYKIDPSYGPHAGNTSISITGNGFSGASAVNFGAAPGVNFKALNDGLLRVTTPAVSLDLTGKADTKSAVEVWVVYPVAQNRLVGTFYYYTIKLGPDRETNKTKLHIYGSGLKGATQIQFGELPPIKLDNVSDDLVQLDDEHYPQELKDTHEEVEVALIFSPDSPTKRSVIGRFAYPPPPESTTPK